MVGKTRAVDNTVTPEWGERFGIPVHSHQGDPLLSSLLRVEVYDFDKIGAHDFLGEVLIAGWELTVLLEKGQTQKQKQDQQQVVTQVEAREFPLGKKPVADGGAKKQKLVKGSITISLRLVQPLHADSKSDYIDEDELMSMI